MPKAVTRRAGRVVRPPLAQDRVRLPRLAAIALGCFALGVAAVVWNAGGERIAPQDPPQPVPEARGAPDGQSQDDAPPELTPDAGRLPAFVVAEGDAATALAATPEPADAGVPVPSATPFDGARRVEPGRVAYLRCDGLPQRPGPYPCPRDEALETAVWTVLDTLPRCADAPPGLGESDVRLEIAAGAPTEVKLRAPRPDVPRLDGPALLRCVTGPLSHVATSTRATKLVLAFRFALVDARRGDSRIAPARTGTP